MPVTNVVLPQRTYQPAISRPVEEKKTKSDIELLFGGNPFSSGTHATESKMGFSTDDLFK